jgi:hypothetical protein
MKNLFTSPSLESLNNRATEAWTDPLSDSSSNSSSSTITPSNYKSQISLITSEKASPSNTPNENIPTESTPSQTLIEIISESWKLTLEEESKKHIQFITDIAESKNQINEETVDKLVESFINIIITYDGQINLYNNRSNLDWAPQDANNFKIGLYFFRKWINKNSKIILPNFTELEIGNITDEPSKISDWFQSNLKNL